MQNLNHLDGLAIALWTLAGIWLTSRAAKKGVQK